MRRGWSIAWLLVVGCGPGPSSTDTDADSTEQSSDDMGATVPASTSADVTSSSAGSVGSAETGESTAAGSTTAGDTGSTTGVDTGNATAIDTGNTTAVDTGDTTGGIETTTPDACVTDVPIYDAVLLSLPADAEPFGLAPIELFGDAAPDLLVTDASGRVLLFDAVYEAPIEPLALDVAGIPRDATVGDFDDASGLDFVVANGAAGATNLWIGLADGTGDYSMQSIDVGGSPFTLASGWFDDGDNLDLAVLVDPGAGNVLELRGQGDGSFVEGFEFAVQSQPTEFATADLDADGRADFFGTNTGQGGILLRQGLGDGYDNAGDLELDDLATGATAADIDGDAVLDLIVVSNGDGIEGRAWVWQGSGGLAYGAPTIWSAPFPLRFVIVTDLDMDGTADIVAGRDDDAAPHALWVLRGRVDDEPCWFEIPLDERPHRFIAPAADRLAPAVVVTTTTSVQLLYP